MRTILLNRREQGELLEPLFMGGKICFASSDPPFICEMGVGETALINVDEIHSSLELQDHLLGVFCPLFDIYLRVDKFAYWTKQTPPVAKVQELQS